MVANGTTTTVVQPPTAHCKKLAAAGAVRVRWPEDLTREVPETETFSWHVLQEADWREDAHLGWRLTQAALRERAEALQTDERAPKRRK